MSRVALVLLVAVTLTVSGAIGLARSTDDAAPPPVVAGGADASTLDRLSSSELQASISSLQEHLRAQPRDAVGWSTLALALVERARISGDPSSYPSAEQAARRSLRVQPVDNDRALGALAALATARHEFARALTLANRALAINPYQPGGLVVRVDALTELGRYDQQLHALEVADRRQPGLGVFARYSYAYELRGDLNRASELLRRSLTPTASPADRAFLLTQLAELDRRRSRLSDAARLLRQALQAIPDYVPAQVSSARLAVAQGRFDDAERWWRKVVTRLPLPEHVVALGELYESTGQEAQAQQQYDVVAATRRLQKASGVRGDLELALFEADHGDPQVALRAARTEWSRRRSIHAADALGWALHAADRDFAALRHARLATRLGTVEAPLWLHRGLIEAGLGRDAAARRHLRHGLRIDPGSSPLLADHARQVLRRLR